MKTHRLTARINDTIAAYIKAITARTGESTTALLERLIIQEYDRQQKHPGFTPSQSPPKDQAPDAPSPPPPGRRDRQP